MFHCLLGAAGLTPDIVQRIRQTALRRAAAQRAATATGRTGMRGQPQSQIRPVNGRGVRPQSRAELAAAMRRRMNAQNNARRSGIVPRSQIGTTRQVVRPTEQIQTRNTMPTRVDEAVLRANIMPAGTGTGSDSVQNVVTTTTTSSETSSSSKSSSSSSNNVLTSGSSSSGVDILQTAAPLLNQGQPTDIQFRSAVDNAASNVPKAVDFSGIGTSLPALETGPAFQVAGNSGDTSLPMDIGVASGQGLGGNQLFDSIAAANALQDIGNTIPSVLPTEDPNLLAAGAFGPSFPQGNTGMGQSISIEPEIQVTNPMAGLEGPLTSMGTGLGMGTLNPDPTAIGKCYLDTNTTKPLSFPILLWRFTKSTDQFDLTMHTISNLLCLSRIFVSYLKPCKSLLCC